MATRKSPFFYFTFIFIISCILYFPFLNKAFHIDSNLAVYSAYQLLKKPLDPPLGEYGNTLRYAYHTEMNINSLYHVLTHPPLFTLSLIPVAYFSPGREWAFHLWMSIYFYFSIAAVWLFFRLYFDIKESFWGTIFWVTSPALILNATNIMWDVPVACFVLSTIVLAVHGKRHKSLLLIAFSGAMAGLGLITKMTALPLYPLFSLYFIWKRQWLYLLCWLLPACFFPSVWVTHNILVFDKIHYLNTGHFNPLIGDIRYRFERIGGYLGACMIFPFWWLYLVIQSKKMLLNYLLFASITLIWGALLFFLLEKSLMFSFSYVVAASIGFWILFQICTMCRKSCPISIPEDEAVLLSAFSIIYLIMMLFLPLAAVRYLLPILPLALLFLISALKGLPHKKVFLYSALGFNILCTLSLGYADYLTCDADRRLSQVLINKGYLPAHTWYYGTLSMDYYLYKNGFRNLKSDGQFPKSGDFLLEQRVPNGFEVTQALPPGLSLEKKELLDFHWFPLKTFGDLAGFWGFSRIPYWFELEKPQKSYCVYEIIEKE